MRETYAEAKLINYDDIAALAKGIIKPEEVRSVTLRGRIDTGATALVIPREVFQQLGLRQQELVRVKYADERASLRPSSSAVQVEIKNRRMVTFAIIEEKGEVLIGNPVIEAMDFRVDSVTGELLPRHPEFPTPVEEIL